MGDNTGTSRKSGDFCTMQTQAPPTLPRDKQPFIRLLMPAVMLIAVVGMVAAMILSGSGRNPISFIFPLMMLGSMAMMFQPGANVDETRRSFHRHIDALKDLSLIHI